MLLKFLVISTITSILVAPGHNQANMNIETVKSAQEAIINENVRIMYAKYPTEIFAAPDEDSEILGCSLSNTSFEVVASVEEWSLITTEDSIAYVKTEALSDTEVLYLDTDLYILAHVLAGEAQSLSDEEQRYVGSVVLNRVKHSSFPNTIEGVVFQRGQYSCVKDGNYYREPTERNWSNAKWLLENGSILPEYVVWQSGGKQGDGVYVKTKWHYYCY